MFCFRHFDRLQILFWLSCQLSILLQAKFWEALASNSVWPIIKYLTPLAAPPVCLNRTLINRKARLQPSYSPFAFLTVFEAPCILLYYTPNRPSRLAFQGVRLDMKTFGNERFYINDTTIYIEQKRLRTSFLDDGDKGKSRNLVCCTTIYCRSCWNWCNFIYGLFGLCSAFVPWKCSSGWGKGPWNV